MALSMAILVSVSLVSCGDDDDVFAGGDVSELIGTWDFQTGVEKVEVMGESVTVAMSRSDLANMKSQLSGMLGARVEIWDETLMFTSSELNGVKYKVDGSKLKLEGQPDGFSIKIKSVTSTKLVLHEEIDIEEMAKDLDMEEEFAGLGMSTIVADMEYTKR